MSETRALAHELVDSLPEERIPALLNHLRSIVDPAAEALHAAPIDDEDETDGEAEAVAEARDWLDDRGGRGIPHSDAMRRLGLE
ncbi:MAG: hypothetical protein H6509_15545 [Bryobacterales bacterium]|nr:hypothetical protein [Bryobacterales bacterium]